MQAGTVSGGCSGLHDTRTTDYRVGRLTPANNHTAGWVVSAQAFNPSTQEEAERQTDLCELEIITVYRVSQFQDSQAYTESYLKKQKHYTAKPNIDSKDGNWKGEKQRGLSKQL